MIRQLNTSIAISTLTSGQCRLAPLIQVIQDCSPLYHFTVKLLFKLHSCKGSAEGNTFKYCFTVLMLMYGLGSCHGFQVSLLTPYKDTVNVSMTSSTGTQGTRPQAGGEHNLIVLHSSLNECKCGQPPRFVAFLLFDYWRGRVIRSSFCSLSLTLHVFIVGLLLFCPTASRPSSIKLETCCTSRD